MPEFLVGFTYHDPQTFALWQKGLIEDYESSTGVWIDSENSSEAIAWGEQIAAALHRKVNADPAADWAGHGHKAWVEESPATCHWQHCLGFFQRVHAGEMPLLDQMGTDAYVRWCEVNLTSTQEAATGRGFHPFRSIAVAAAKARDAISKALFDLS